MAKSTLKTLTDCDYLVYLNKDHLPCGFELTQDERQSLAIRYHVKDEEWEPTLPEAAVYVLEVFGIPSTIIGVVDEDQKWELIFYKPSILAFAREIGDSMDTALEIMEYEPSKGKATPAKKVEDKDVKAEEKDLRDTYERELIARLPFENWMTIYWGTAMWMKVWEQRKDLQECMAEFAKRYKPSEVRA